MTKKENLIYDGLVSNGFLKKGAKYSEFIDRCANILKGYNVKNFVSIDHHFDVLSWVVNKNKPVKESVENTDREEFKEDTVTTKQPDDKVVVKQQPSVVNKEMKNKK